MGKLAQRMPTSPRILALALALLTLTGCFDFLEEIWINEDGSGRVRIDLGISTALFSLGGARVREELEREFKAEAERARAAVAQDPDVKKISVESRDDGDLHRIIYELEVRDVTRLPEIHRRLREGSAKLSASGSDAVDFEMRIEETGQGYRFSQAFGAARGKAADGGASVPRKSGADAVAEAFAEQMISAMFADKGLTIRVHGPEFASHNGQLAQDGKSVEWKVPFSSIISGEGQTLQAEVVTGKATIFYAAGGAVALLIVLAGLSLGRKGRRRH